MRVVFVGRNRVVWRRLLLYLLTFGVSRRVWLYRINREIDGHEALGLRHGVTLALLVLPIVGPSIVTWQVAGRTRAMLRDSGLPYGPGPLVWAATLVPILGNLFFIAWQQTRLNRFWTAERNSAAHGIEVDIDLSGDPGFVVELGRALKESYHAGSRFDARKNARKARWRARAQAWSTAQSQRVAIREAGGSTPVAPWRAPKRPPIRVLHITCGRCATAFDAQRDPLADTPLVCPSCAQAEVLPSLRADPLARPQPATIPTLKVSCPQCGATFQAVHNLQGPTPLRCPACGRAEELAPAGAPTAPRSRAPKPVRRAKAVGKTG